MHLLIPLAIIRGFDTCRYCSKCPQQANIVGCFSEEHKLASLVHQLWLPSQFLWLPVLLGVVQDVMVRFRVGITEWSRFSDKSSVRLTIERRRVSLGLRRASRTLQT